MSIASCPSVPHRALTTLAALLAALLVTGCAGGGVAAPPADVPGADAPEPKSSSRASPSPAAAPSPADRVPGSPSAPVSEDAGTPASAASPRPEWLGTRVLALRDDGFGEVVPTPPELVDRRLETPELLPPPPDDTFVSSVGPVPDEVLARSTWSDACPVARDGLAYVTVAFWGFDEQTHTGELLVAAEVADELVEVFRRLHDERFPIEEMRVVAPEELDAPPTGDGNNTTGFVCRATVGQSNWSQHAYGRAVDVNPFHNPYVRGDLVVPELASAYADREHRRPGMIVEGDAVTAAFDAIGWAWGGRWTRPVDPMHFSASGH